MTFRELATQSAQLATYLIALGAGPDVPVALCLERSFDFIVSALAALTSGAAYLPLDPTWPAARLQTILNDAQAPFVISRGSLAARVNSSGTRTIDLDAAADAIQHCTPLAQPFAVTEDNLAYVIYHIGIYRSAERRGSYSCQSSESHPVASKYVRNYAIGSGKPSCGTRL